MPASQTAAVRKKKSTEPASATKRVAQSKSKASSAASFAPEPVRPEQRAPVEIDVRALVFDPDWYRAQYPDVAEAGIDPVRHYFDDGAREGRDPNAYFSTRLYMARYEDVAASRMNPFLHFVLYGAREGRLPKG